MNKKKEALKLAERIARLRVEGDSYRWPPICAGILHQPKRPKVIRSNILTVLVRLYYINGRN